MAKSITIFSFFFFSSIVLYSSKTCLGSNQTDLLSLLALKEAINADPNGALNSWNRTTNFCTWNGVTCGRRHPNRVVAIKLDSQGLIGSLSPHTDGSKSGETITRKLFPATWYRAKETKKEYPFINIPGVRTFSLNELKIATDNFADRNTLSIDGFGKSYKGRLENGFVVEVKRYKHVQKDISPAQQQYFHAEVETMRIAVAHPNLHRVIGGCVTQKEKLLVYPYMANGTVASCLRDRPESRPPLDWQIRKQIAFGAARGLAYLHNGCERKIIYRDVKAANIYLNEDLEAIIGNFEFAVHMDHGVTHVEEAVHGTIGHIAPEYVSRRVCSEKSDVFGYGIFLLELVTGKRAL